MRWMIQIVPIDSIELYKRGVDFIPFMLHLACKVEQVSRGDYVASKVSIP